MALASSMEDGYKQKKAVVTIVINHQLCTVVQAASNSGASNVPKSLDKTVAWRLAFLIIAPK